MSEEAINVERKLFRSQRDYYEDLAHRYASDNASLRDSLAQATHSSTRVRALLKTISEQWTTISSLRSSVLHYTRKIRTQDEMISVLSVRNEELEATVAQLHAELSSPSDDSIDGPCVVDEVAYEEYLNFASFEYSILTDLSSSSSVYPSSSASESLSPSQSGSVNGGVVVEGGDSQTTGLTSDGQNRRRKLGFGEMMCKHSGECVHRVCVYS